MKKTLFIALFILVPGLASASTPTTNLAVGTYIGTQSVTLSSSGSLSIRYTTDGTIPVCSTPTVYSTAISVSTTQTIKAIACYANNIASPVASFAYTINAPAAVVTSGGGGGVSINTAVIPTVVLHADDAVIVPTYSIEEANTRFALGVRLDVTNASTVTVNGTSVIPVSGVVTIASNTSATTIGVHTYNIVVISSTGNTVNMALSYRVNVNSLGTNPLSVVTSPEGSVLGVSVFRFTLSLSIGSRGDEVTKLQERLISEGFLSVEATGYFGKLTREAVRKFQEKNGLDRVGVVGPMTRAKLNFVTVTGTTIPGCALGNKFNILTGQACPVQ